MRSALQIETHSSANTRALGRYLSEVLPPVGVVLLIGDLGAGKTTLAKGIVEGLGVAGADDVSSPTYTLIHQYGEPVRVYHIDLYRLETVKEVRRLGLEDLFEEPVLVLIEWGERFRELMPEDAIEIRLTHLGDDTRKIDISGLTASLRGFSAEMHR
jgi:tRNA threonylcarbamoyladenosine biosynthesis protein TsaE